MNVFLFSPRIVLCPNLDLFKMTLQINSPHLGTEYQVGKGERVLRRDFKFNNLKPFPRRDWFWYYYPYRDVYCLYVWCVYMTYMVKPQIGVPATSLGQGQDWWQEMTIHFLCPRDIFAGLRTPFGCRGCTLYIVQTKTSLHLAVHGYNILQCGRIIGWSSVFCGRNSATDKASNMRGEFATDSCFIDIDIYGI